MARVLVVEADTPTATLIADELGDAGHLVDGVANGADALESLQAYRPDVVVLDLLLPVVHGWALIERYREVTHGQEIPIVVVSAAGAVTRSMEALGVRRYLPKPFQVPWPQARWRCCGMPIDASSSTRRSTCAVSSEPGARA